MVQKGGSFDPYDPPLDPPLIYIYIYIYILGDNFDTLNVDFFIKHSLEVMHDTFRHVTCATHTLKNLQKSKDW